MGTPELTVCLSADRAHTLELLARACAHEVTGAASVEDLVSGCALFDLLDMQGRAVGAFAMRVDQFSTGPEVTVTAAGAIPGVHGATEAVAAWVEAQGRERIGARVTTCQTRRRGMVRKLERSGYRITGYVLTKEI